MPSRMKRNVALIASIALVGGALLAAPAGAKKGKTVRCKPFKPMMEGATEASVLKVTPKHTEDAPLEVELEHGISGPVEPELLYQNVQIFGPSGGLHIREEFDPASDLDLYLYDAGGQEVATSGAFNPAPIPGVFDAEGNGGSGYESIPGVAATSCSGYTIESYAYLTAGTTATLKIWMGDVGG